MTFPPLRLRLLPVLLAAVLAVAVPAWAQESAAEDGGLYLGEAPGGRTLLLVVRSSADGTVGAALLEQPPARGETAGLDLAVTGRSRPAEGFLRLAAEGRSRSGASPPAHIELSMPLAHDGRIDPFGTAEASFRRVPSVWREAAPEPDEAPSPPLVLRLTGIGTLLSSNAALADGSLRAKRRSPLFYADPWRTLDLVSYARLEVDAALAEGLEQRRERPRSVSGAWWNDRTARIESLGPSLLSLRIETHAYRGGAHPNTYLARRWRPWGATATPPPSAKR